MLVLRIAIRLVGAEKGLLISDGEDRRVVACEGFDADPSESQLVKRFADDVIERDTIVREADPEPPAEGASPADAEIENLIAIPIYVRDEFHGVVVCANSDDVERHDDEVLVALGNQAGVILNNAALHGERHDAYVATVRMLAEAISIKDPHLGGHSHEVSAYVGRVADRLGLEPKRREELIFASLLHDVGKIGISERILLKPAGLTDEEYAAIKLHPRIGCRLVEQVPALSQLGPYILHHHEWFDGSGYPTGLKGEEIPLEARVIGIVDAFSAMTSDRPYRGRMSLEEACSELERCAGTQFDPEVVRIFVEEVRREPPSADAEDTALTALADPELAAVRSDDGPLVGTGPLDLVDHLTLLYTHRYFHEVAAAAAERANLDGVPFCITMFQLADIAEVNEDAGYGAGDALIKSAGRAVQEAAVRSGGTAARYSGRRIALLAECDSEANEALVASVRASLGDATRLAIGHAQWKPGDDGEDVIGRAEREMGALAGASEGAAPVPAEL